MATWQKEKQMRYLADVTGGKALGGHDVHPRRLTMADRRF